MSDSYTPIMSTVDVTDEVLRIAESIYDGWFADGHAIDWEEFLDRLDGATLDDGSTLDLGRSLVTPAIAKIRRHIQYYRKL
jgi:hypothetical protein